MISLLSESSPIVSTNVFLSLKRSVPNPSLLPSMSKFIELRIVGNMSMSEKSRFSSKIGFLGTFTKILIHFLLLKSFTKRVPIKRWSPKITMDVFLYKGFDFIDVRNLSNSLETQRTDALRSSSLFFSSVLFIQSGS